MNREFTGIDPSLNKSAVFSLNLFAGFNTYDNSQKILLSYGSIISVMYDLHPRKHALY